MRKILVLVLLTPFLLVGCGETTTTRTKIVSSSVDEVVKEEIDESPASSETPETKQGKVGEAIRVGDYEIKVIDWRFAKPSDFGLDNKPGKKLVVADFEVTNKGSKVLGSDMSLVSLRTPEGYEYDGGWGYKYPEPLFPNSDIDPGGKSRGWIGFEVPENINGMEIQFNAGSDGMVKIPLEQ